MSDPLKDWHVGWKDRDMWDNYELMRMAVSFTDWYGVAWVSLKRGHRYCPNCGCTNLRIKTSTGDYSLQSLLDEG